MRRATAASTNAASGRMRNVYASLAAAAPVPSAPAVTTGCWFAAACACSTVSVAAVGTTLATPTVPSTCKNPLRVTASLMSVSMKPGAIAFTVTPRLANSTASARVKALIAPLLAA